MRFLARLYQPNKSPFDFQFTSDGKAIHKEDLTHVGFKRPLEEKTANIIMDNLFTAMKNFNNRYKDVMNLPSKVEIYAKYDD